MPAVAAAVVLLFIIILNFTSKLDDATPMTHWRADAPARRRTGASAHAYKLVLRKKEKEKKKQEKFFDGTPNHLEYDF